MAQNWNSVFLSQTEFEQLRNTPEVIVEKADAFIRKLQSELEVESIDSGRRMLFTHRCILLVSIYQLVCCPSTDLLSVFSNN